jgi:LmbE family N-acetylglucosaminyl deacetylase
VITFGPDGMTGHADHVTVSRWTTMAFRRASLPGSRLLYATITHESSQRLYDAVDPGQVMMNGGMTPPSVDQAEVSMWLELDESLLDVKVSALRCQASQVDPLLDQLGERRFRELFCDESFRDPDVRDWPS